MASVVAQKTVSTLHVSTRSEVSLMLAVNETFGMRRDVLALLYARLQFSIARWTAGSGFVVAGGIFDWQEVYEAQVFTSDATLHWQRSNASTGFASVLSEQSQLGNPWSAESFQMHSMLKIGT